MVRMYTQAREGENTDYATTFLSEGLDNNPGHK